MRSAFDVDVLPGGRLSVASLGISIPGVWLCTCELSSWVQGLVALS